MILEIDNVELYRSGRAILHGIYLQAKTGHITSLLGRNGSGKSCLLHILFGSLKPKFGLVRIDHQPISIPLYKTGYIAFLPQTKLLPNNLKICTAFKLFNIKWRDFTTNFRDLEHLKNSRANRLSGGERRLIETYLILKSRSKIILLDEPFSHIGPIYIETLKTLIIHAKRDKAIIITDQHHTHISSICDDLYLLRDGSTIKVAYETQLEDYGYLPFVKE